MAQPAPDNYAKSYMCWNDGTPCEVPAPALGDGTIIGPAGGLESSVNDLMVVYDSFMQSAEHQLKTGSTRSEGSPFVHATKLLEPCIKKNKTSYGLGWFLTDLPGETGWIGLNRVRVKQMPTIAQGIPPTPIAYHNGNMPGALSSVHIIPSTKTAIVVLANSIPFSDVPDWVGGILLEAFLGSPQKNDFVALAREARDTVLAKTKEAADGLAKGRKQGTTHGPLKEFQGSYYNNLGNWFLDVQVQEDGLVMRVQGLEKTKYPLSHYHDDVFFWPLDREAEMQAVMFPSWYDEMHKIKFVSEQGGGKIASLVWKYSRDIPSDGEVFKKSPDGKACRW